MDVKEIAGMATVPVVQPLSADTTPQPVPTPEVKSAEQSVDTGPYALHPVVKVDSDGLALLQLQDAKSGEVVYQVPSEAAARHYRERDGSDGAGTTQVEQVAAVTVGAFAVSATAGAVAAAAANPVPTPTQPAKDNVVLPQAVKPVEPSAGSKQPGSVRVRA